MNELQPRIAPPTVHDLETMVIEAAIALINSMPVPVEGSPSEGYFQSLYTAVNTYQSRLVTLAREGVIE